MQLLFIYGPVASGKLTIARGVAERTGLPLFHNHLIVDAVAAVFPFGSKQFVHLREQFWLETIAAAAAAAKSLIFTFAPEPTVAPDFPRRVSRLVEAAGGEVVYAALDVTPDEQERRIVEPGRSAFGKLRSLDILREIRSGMNNCMLAMPHAALRIDTGAMTADQAADAIARLVRP